MTEGPGPYLRELPPAPRTAAPGWEGRVRRYLLGDVPRPFQWLSGSKGKGRCARCSEVVAHAKDDPAPPACFRCTDDVAAAVREHTPPA